MTNYSRISITIPETLLKNLDTFVKLKQKENPGANRSSVLSDLVEVNVPISE